MRAGGQKIQNFCGRHGWKPPNKESVQGPDGPCARNSFHFLHRCIRPALSASDRPIVSVRSSEVSAAIVKCERKSNKCEKRRRGMQQLAFIILALTDDSTEYD